MSKKKREELGYVNGALDWLGGFTKRLAKRAGASA